MLTRGPGALRYLLLGARRQQHGKTTAELVEEAVSFRRLHSPTQVPKLAPPEDSPDNLRANLTRSQVGALSEVVMFWDQAGTEQAEETELPRRPHTEWVQSRADWYWRDVGKLRLQCGLSYDKHTYIWGAFVGQTQ